MWGSVSGASLTVLELHVQLADLLASEKWNRVQIWDGKVSVHEWSVSDGFVVAFDVVPKKGYTQIAIIARQRETLTRLRSILDSEKVEFGLIEEHPTLTIVGDITREGQGVTRAHALEVAKTIHAVRSAIDQHLLS